jgi:2-polyprenyl-3-methyl-5-hydroxy-6-metoxy-1,4-benzoquinol methylase
MKSPLFPESETSCVGKVPAETLVKIWDETMAIDIRAEISTVQEVKIWRCHRSGLLFFDPQLAGGENLYGQLQKHSWYYMPTRWEFSKVISMLPNQAKVLDIGCGVGYFLLEAKSAGHDVFGLDFSEEVVRSANLNGIASTTQTVRELAKDRSKSFDAVTLFHVLEHVRDPLTFLKDIHALVKPRGKIFISVPDSDSYLSKTFSPLDMPPHHILRWNAQSLSSLQCLLPWILADCWREPLPKEHIRTYIRSLLIPWSWSQPPPHSASFFQKFLGLLLLPSVRNQMADKLLHGETILAVFTAID